MLNRYLFLFLLFLGFQTTYAQLEKGSNLIGGSIYFNIEDNDGDREQQSEVVEESSSNYSLRLSPTYGRFIKDSLLLGVTVNGSISWSKSEYFSDVSRNLSERNGYGIGVSPFIRKYCKLWKKMGVFGDVGLIFGIQNSKSETENIVNDEVVNESESSYNTTHYGVFGAVGLYYQLSNRFLLQATLISINGRYINTEREFGNDTNSDNTTETGFRGDLNFSNSLSSVSINYLF